VTGDILDIAGPYLAVARIALALWLMLASAHWIVGAAVFAPDGAIPWAQMPDKGFMGQARRRMSTRTLRVWMVLQFAIAAALLAAASPPLAIACLVAALFSHGGFILLSGNSGSSGADKMGLIVLVGTLIGTVALVTGDAALLLAGCLVSGGQLLICYMVAGVSKLRQAHWRSGAELAGVMAHPIWGAPWAAAVLRPGPVALAASWALMVSEALFPLALLAPEPWLTIALAVMFSFHVATALIMRLTLFPWAFVAAYPSVLLLGQFFHRFFADTSRWLA
jgi:hypothetical protein